MEKNKTLTSLSAKEILDLYKKAIWESKSAPDHRTIDYNQVENFILKTITYYQQKHSVEEKKDTQEIDYTTKVGP